MPAVSCEHPWEPCGWKATHTFRSVREVSPGFAYVVALCAEHLADELSGGIGYDRTVTVTPIREV
jgi:hypothetical protein